MIDALTLPKRLEIGVLDHGMVKLVDCMPRLIPDGLTGDYAIAEMARASYGQGTKKTSDDEGLIRFLLRHNHTSPVEAVEFKFYMRLPLFVFAQLVRHRTANVNSESFRYSEVKDEFFVPSEWRGQSTTNKQMSNGLVDYTRNGFDVTPDHQSLTAEEIAFKEYNSRLEAGVARELARTCLPVSTYTNIFWKIDLKNLLHFLALRCDEHAQKEIRVYSDAILELISTIVPVTIKAWDDYHPMRGAILFTKQELALLSESINHNLSIKLCIEACETMSKREKTEFLDKLSKMGV